MRHFYLYQQSEQRKRKCQNNKSYHWNHGRKSPQRIQHTKNWILHRPTVTEMTRKKRKSLHKSPADLNWQQEGQTPKIIRTVSIANEERRLQELIYRSNHRRIPSGNPYHPKDKSLNNQRDFKNPIGKELHKRQQPMTQ